MKKIVLSTILVMLAVLLSAQNYVEFTSSEGTAPAYNIISSNDTIVTFNVVVPGMFEASIDTFNRINILEHNNLDSIGFPELPVVTFLVAIPKCDSVNLQISIFDSVQFSGYNVYPAPEIVEDTIVGGGIGFVEQFSYDTTAYETDAMFPGYVVETTDKGAIRDQHVIKVVIYPVQFNPVKDIVKVYSDLQINLTFNNSTGAVNSDVGIFNEIVGGSLINYKSNGLNASVNNGAGLDSTGSWKWATSFINDAIMDTCDYLIITDEVFFNDQSAKVYIDSLARYRAEFNGFDVVMVKMLDIEDSISGSNNTMRIRNLIENTFNYGYANNTYDGKLAYVNLFGDVFFGDEEDNKCVPTYLNGNDVYFTKLTYDSIANQYDVYPDLMIGRCSVDTITQVQNVVHKILNFKPDTLAWKQNMFTYIGFDNVFSSKESEVMFEVDDIVGNRLQKKLMIPPGFDRDFPDWDTIPYITPGINYPGNDIRNLLAGIDSNMFINYMDHGNHSSWFGTFNFDSLNSSHNDHLPFIISAACYTGEFHKTGTTYEDCMAEHFLSYDKQKGAIGFVGASTGTGAPEFSIISAYFKSLISNGAYVIGEALMETKIRHHEWRDHYTLEVDGFRIGTRKMIISK